MLANALSNKLDLTIKCFQNITSPKNEKKSNPVQSSEAQDCDALFQAD